MDNAHANRASEDTLVGHDLVVIRGAKGDQGSTRTPIQGEDTLFSTAYAHILDLVSEGEIGGLVDGLRSVYLDETPLQNADGSMNFKGVTVDVRLGTADQDYMPGFPAIESEVGVGVELKQVTPWTQALTDMELSAVSVRLSTPSLGKSDPDTGDSSGYSVSYAIDLSTDGGAFVTVYNGVMTGKTSTKYERTHRIDLPAATVSGWAIRVRRITADSTDVNVQDVTTVEAYTSIIDAKMRYPYSALIGVSVDSSQFRSVPRRAYNLFGIILQVPSNYDPYTRAYTGVWDGTFKSAWTNNPAWLYYAMATNERFGLGSTIKPEQVDKWALYSIAQYCDAPVPTGEGKRTTLNYGPVQMALTATGTITTSNGDFLAAGFEVGDWVTLGADFGVNGGITAQITSVTATTVKLAGTFTARASASRVLPLVAPHEPRFTTTIYLQRRGDAYKVLQDLASTFQGISYWGNGAITAAADRPEDPVYTYTNANVVDGKFSYAGTGRRARHTVALVGWNDPSDFGRGKIEYVSDDEGIARYGIQETNVTAFGCTSQSQAQRVGRWILTSERVETDTVSFNVGMDGTLIAPGRIVRIADENRMGKRVGGRISASTLTTITVDKLPSPAPVAGNTVIVALPTGLVESRAIQSVDAVSRIITVTTAFSAKPVAESVWAIESTTLYAPTYRIIGVTEGEGISFNVTALRHEPAKFDAIELGTRLNPKPTSLLPKRVLASPTGLVLSARERAGFVFASPLINASWTKTPGAAKYLTQWRREDGEWSPAREVLGPNDQYDNAFAGKYDFRVWGVNASGIPSLETTASITVADQALKPGFVEGLELSISDALTTAQNAEAIADGAVVSFWVPTPPVIGSGAGQAKEGDIWFDTSDGNRIYRVVSGAWADAQDDDLALALAAAADAQSTADGKVKTYFSATAPTGTLALGDLWFNTTTKKLFRWSGSAWDQNIADVTLDQIAGSGVNILWDEYSQPNSQTDDLVSSAAGVVPSFDPTQSVGSTNGSLRLDVTSDLVTAYVTLGTSVTDYNLPLEPGKKYIVSASVRSTFAGALVRPLIKNSSASLFHASVPDLGPGTALVWDRISWVVDPSANLQDNGLLIFYVNRGAVATNYTIWLDRIMVEEMKGNLEFPSSWQPGPAGRQALVAISNAATAQATADGKINSFFQDAPPAIGSSAGQAQEGDIWFDTNDGNKIYTVVGTAWVATPDSRIAQAIADAAGAQATADGKVKTFYQDATPTAEGVGDLWYSSLTLLLKRWDGSSWTGTDFASADGENLLPNSSFVSNNTGCPLTVEHTVSDALCDGWVVDAAGNGITNTGVSYTGKSVRLRAYATDPIPAATTVEVRAATSKPISVQEGKTYEFGFTTSGNTFNGSVAVPATIDVRQRLNVRWYDEDGVSISYVQAVMVQQRSSGTVYGKVVAPAGARTCKVIIAVYARNMTASAWSISDGGGSVLVNAYFRRVWMRKIDELRVAGSTERIGDQRNLPGSLTSAYGVTNTTAALSATSGGAISVLAHSKRYGATSVSYSAVSNAITGKAVGSSWVIYCIDPDYSGGVQTWLAAADVNTVMNLGDGIVVAGTIKIPSSGSSSGGGGGNGSPDTYCVDWDSVLPDGRLVRDLVPGDLVPCVDVTALEPRIEMHPLISICFGEEECFAIITEDGVMVEQSRSTPMDLRDGRQVKTPEMLGEQVLTLQDGEMRWNVVERLASVGSRRVCKINVGDRMFFAGVCAEATLATHNIKWSP